MFKYLALIAATVSASSSSFCGCGGCDIDWLSGSTVQKSILLGLSCSNFQQLLTAGTVPAISVTDGELCEKLLPQIQSAQVMGKTASDFLGPNSTCPSGLALNLNAADPEEMIAMAEELEANWSQ